MFKFIAYFCGLTVITTFIGFASADCIQCSSAVDVNCLMAQSIIPTNCTPASQSCFMRIVDGVTIRGCLSDLQQDVANDCNNLTCQTCTNIMGRPGCNDGVFPNSRRRCYICSGAGNDTTCALEQTMMDQVCELYSPTDRCFIARFRGDIFRRGCTSSAAICEEQGNCHVCDSNGCNSMNVNGLELPELPDSAIINKATTLLMLLCLGSITFFKSSF